MVAGSRRWLACFGLLALVAGGPGLAQGVPALLVVGSVEQPYESLLLAVDGVTGRVSTLFQGPFGELTAVSLDRTRMGCLVAYTSPVAAGVHHLTPAGGGGLSLAATFRGGGAQTTLRAVFLGHEDFWLVGTDPEEGYGRLRRVEEGTDSFVDLENFPGAVTAGLVDERRSDWVLATAGARTGALWLYDVSQGRKASLAPGLPPAVGLAAAPYGEGYLVVTRTRALLLVSRTGQVAATFSLAGLEPPSGLVVWLNPGSERHPLFVLGRRHLYRFSWLSDRRQLSTLEAAFRLPVKQANGLALAGDAGTLLRVTRQRQGGRFTFALGPGGAGLTYLLGAALANNPGMTVDGRRWINLAPDPLLFASLLSGPNSVFINFAGTTDATGTATAHLRVPDRWRSLLNGLTVYVAGIVLDPAFPANVRTVTNTVGLTLF